MKQIEILIFLSLTVLNEVKLTLNQISTKTNLYTKINNFNNFQLDNSFLLRSFDSQSKINCLSSCTNKPECVYSVYQNKKCYICKKNFTLFANYIMDGQSLIYQKKFDRKYGLINYWTFNGNVNDSIGNAHLYGGVNATLTSNRFGQSNSALSLSNGYYKVPPGVYFSGEELTIMAWVKVNNHKINSRLIDFGNGAAIECIVVTLSTNTNGKPYFFLQLGNNYFNDFSTIELSLYQWQHLALVYSFPYYSIYIDGIEVTPPGSKTTYSSFNLTNVLRSSNFIGRSNWISYGDQDADADYDDLKIFDRAFAQKEIQFEMHNNL